MLSLQANSSFATPYPNKPARWELQILPMSAVALRRYLLGVDRILFLAVSNQLK